MYPSPHCFTDCLIDFRAASYEVFDANLDVKWMSSRFSPCVFALLDMNSSMDLPTSRSL